MSIRSNVDARRLDQRISIQRRIESKDSLGAPASTWEERICCPAAVDASLARDAEQNAADAKRPTSSVTFWIRADIVERFGVVLTDRVVWKDRNYDIRDMPDQQLRGRRATLIATTGLNQG